jgi:hypothetical protein
MTSSFIKIKIIIFSHFFQRLEVDWRGSWFSVGVAAAEMRIKSLKQP